MRITINNNITDIEPGLSLEQIVMDHIGPQQNGIAVALNHTVIPKAEYPAQLLQDGDQILIIKATQGG